MKLKEENFLTFWHSATAFYLLVYAQRKVRLAYVCISFALLFNLKGITNRQYHKIVHNHLALPVANVSVHFPYLLCNSVTNTPACNKKNEQSSKIKQATEIYLIDLFDFGMELKLPPVDRLKSKSRE